jgi:hypothetical protein
MIAAPHVSSRKIRRVDAPVGLRPRPQRSNVKHNI